MNVRKTCSAAVRPMEKKHQGLPRSARGWNVEALMKRVVMAYLHGTRRKMSPPWEDQVV